MKKKEQEDKDREDLDKDTAKDNPTNLPNSSSGTITGSHIPLVELGLIPYTPSN